MTAREYLVPVIRKAVSDDALARHIDYWTQHCDTQDSDEAAELLALLKELRELRAELKRYKGERK
jgi:hypothetical protein